MIRIGNYGISSDNYNFILTTFGQKVRRIEAGETPKEVVKSTGYYSSFDNLVKAIANEELLTQIDNCNSLVEAYSTAYNKLINNLNEFNKKNAEGKNEDQSI